jgi:hypothetical protein
LLTIGPNRIEEAQEYMRLLRAELAANVVIGGLIPRNNLPVDITRALERIAGISTPGEPLPVRIKPEILDYIGILKLATDIVTVVIPKSEHAEHYKKMLQSLLFINPSQLKDARSQLDMIWFTVKVLLLEDN